MRMARAPVLFCREAAIWPTVVVGSVNRCGFVAVLIRLPSELVDHAGQDSVGLAHVPGVMEPINDQVVFADVGELLLLDRISGERRLLVEMVVEGGLVRDDEVFAAGYGLFEYRVGIHERGDDAGHHGVGVAGLERIDGADGRDCSGCGDDALHHFGGGEAFAGSSALRRLREDRNTSDSQGRGGNGFLIRNTEPPRKTWVGNESTWRDEGR